MKRKIVQAWDSWICHRAMSSLQRVAINNPGFSYLIELHLHDWNEAANMPSQLKRAAERFHESLNRVTNDIQ